MKKYLFAYPVLFSTTILLGIFVQALGIAATLFSMVVIDALTDGEASRFFIYVYAGGALILLYFGALSIYGKVTSKYFYKTKLKIKTDAFQSIFKKDIAEFTQENSAVYISLINNDIEFIGDNYIGNILEMVKFIATAVFSFLAIALLSPINALIALVLSSFPLLIPIIFGEKLAAINLEHMSRLGKLNEKAKDFLSGFEVIKAFAIEKQANEILSTRVEQTERARYEVGKFNISVILATTVTMMVATQFLTYLVAGYFVLTGQITVGAVVAIAGLAANLGQPIHMISGHLAGIKSTKKIREKFLVSIGHQMSSEKKEIASFEDGLILTDLSFYYPKKAVDTVKDTKKKKPRIKIFMNDGNLEESMRKAGIDPNEVKMMNLAPDSDISIKEAQQILEEVLEENLMETSETKPKPILTHISYGFKKGGKYAIIGPSGSGKSTLAKILMGYYDNYEGSARLGQKEIREINRESLYHGLSIIHQDVFVLDDTLKNNITLYSNYDETIYNNTLKQAQLLDLSNSLPEGSNTALEEAGNVLSGGERQRIAIARALIKDSKVVIMDEATSHLDTKTAYDIEMSLIKTQQTVIFVTHRYSKDVLEQCDGILVLKDGELIETGTFKELYENKGYFYSLYTINSRSDQHV